MKYFILSLFFLLQLICFGIFDSKSFTYIATHKSRQKQMSRNYKNSPKNGEKYVISLDTFKKNGFINKAQLLKTYTINVYWTTKNSTNKSNFYVMRYSVTQKLKTGLTKSFVVGGPLITDDLRQSFKTLTNGDSIIIHDIFADGPNGIEKLSDELIFVVKEI